jgi:hypothetical protein
MWCQALDNQSDDHIELNGAMLTGDDNMKRQQAVSAVSSVIKSGRKLYSKDDVILTADKSSFCIEVPSEQKDVAGRIAPMIYVDDISTSSSASVSTKLSSFAFKVGRTISGQSLILVKEAFSKLKK